MFLRSVVELKNLPENDRPHVALVGRSNVGKSSLVNALSGRKGLARVSAEPGRTQTINVYEPASTHYLLDLPGYGFARHAEARERLTKLVTDYLAETSRLALVLLVIDARRGPTDLDEEMLGWLRASRRPVALVLSKADKLTREERTKLDRALAAAHPDLPRFFHSTKDQTGRGELSRAIEQAVRRARA